ncbi:MAG TPA: hypothetical protein VK993_09810 [Chthoniobacterales bacterium]|nr:hypothetical protein [Chthoniobacterales bacterium]
MLTLLLALAGIAGFLVSYCLLRAGVDHMWMRYPVAVLAGYAVLLGLVRGWVELEKRRFDPDDPAIRNAVAEPTLHDWPRRRWWDWLDFPGIDIVDVDEGCIPILLLGFVIVVIVAALTAIAGAPALIAEVFLDAFLVAVLYRQLRMAHEEHWLGTAIRKTWTLAFLAAALLAIAGFILEQLAPGARSIGPAIEQLTRG